jgi:hypothetical protein
MLVEQPLCSSGGRRVETAQALRQVSWKPWTNFLCYSSKRRFLRSFPSNPPDSPAICGIPHPPAAAPAAGGWGIPRSRLVYSVGFGGSPAVGVWEVVALLSGWCVWSARFPSGGGVLRSVAVAREAFLSSGPLDLSLGTLGLARIWRLKTVVRCFAEARKDLGGVTPSGAVMGGFNPAQGLASSFQGSWTSSGSGAPPSRHGRRPVRGRVGLRCNLCGFLTFL